MSPQARCQQNWPNWSRIIRCSRVLGCTPLSGQLSGLVCIFIDFCLGNRNAAFGGGQNVCVFDMFLCCMPKNQRVTSPPNRCSIKLQGARQTAQTTAETKKRNPRAINKKTQRDLWIIIVCLVFSVLSGSLGYACWFGLGGGSHPLGFVTCSTKTY